ncbi:hypothetical protein L484_004396 [Morus notabilis]|uniref:Kunitz-type serine protease inhibitor n=1 Tax=Morus notabilis TaxID=981085 RepID=W9RU50_9ROSA|nr:kunitz-type serine protease inhibitor [Morus notabilis]EXC10218.1 hypothetical protein L484_004396 [Morus notabilis]
MEAISLVTVFLLFLSFTTRGVSARPSLGVLPPAVVDSSGNELLKGKYYDLLAWPNAPIATLPGWFKIERYSEQPLREYKLLWCPVYVLDQSVRSSDDCQTIGIFADSDGIERLAMADTSVPFGFRAYSRPSYRAGNYHAEIRCQTTVFQEPQFRT